MWVGAGDPVLGAFPVSVQARKRPSDRLRAYDVLGQPLFVSDLGQERLAPEAAALAEGTRRLMKQVLQSLSCGGIQVRLGALGSVGLTGKAIQSVLVERSDHIADGLAASAIGNEFC